MSDMTLTLTPHFKALIEAKVQSGRYSDASEVIREALRLFEQREYEREARLRDMRAAIDAGLASGESQPFAAYGTLGALLDTPVRWHGNDLTERLAEVYASRTPVEG